MFNSISHSGIYVLDQDEAIDFYVGADLQAELADVEVDGFVLVEYVDAGVADAVEHGGHPRQVPGR